MNRIMCIEILANQAIETASKGVEQSASILRQSLDDIVTWGIEKAGSVLIAFIFIIIGMKVVNILLKLLKKSFTKSKLEESVSGFLMSILRVAGYILVFITAATIVGIDVASFVAILGTASLAIGLSLQGALSNLAGGVLILILKPFQVGDYIIENNKNNEGKVVSIDVFYTRLLTHDNKMIVIPNGVLMDNSLVNVTEENKRKLEVKVMVAYQTNMEKLKDVVMDILSKQPLILQQEPKDIFIDEFCDSGMQIAIRAWVKTDDYWPAVWDIREQVKTAFDANGIEIPYQRIELEMREPK